jgi:hypothetical protein
MDMLTTRLENGELFGKSPKGKEQQMARSILNDAVQDLVVAMKAVEEDGLYEREEIENFVLTRLRTYEEIIYAMDREEFDSFLDIQLENVVTRRKMR